MKVMFLLLLALVAGIMATGQERLNNELTCSICVDVVTDIDEWLTSDKTEQEIVSLLEELCRALGLIIHDFEAGCKDLIDTMLPSVIDALVNQMLKPLTVCTEIL